MVRRSISDEDTRAALRLLEAALDLPVNQRVGWLAERCAGNEALHDETRRLLRRATTGAELPELAEIVDLTTVFGSSADALHARGTRIGDFEIVRRIAEGGMGRVYEARQAKPERRVALKVLRVAFTSSEAHRRFAYEAEILARLQHEGIAQVFAAGVHDLDGDEVPFIAMEFVEGARDLARYVREHELTRRARIDLLARICDAVHHGHQKGVVHRDLKPANLLVTEDGDPKIIDFGVARVADFEVDGTSFKTQQGVVLGTLPYMSPEQVEGDLERLDIRTDVYSLGVVLYELLCGRLPHAIEGKPLLEVARLLRDAVPARPSLHDATVGGDLDAVALRALSADPGDRYPSAAELADDLRRWLANEPVRAAAPGLARRFRLFCRRSKALVASAVLVVAILTSATVLSTGFGLEARRSAREADEERAKATELTDRLFEQSVDFVLSYARRIATLPGSTELRVEMLRGATEQLDRLSRDSAGDVRAPLALHLALVDAYLELGDVLGSPFRNNVGDLDAAAECYAQGLALAERALDIDATGHDARLRLADAIIRRGDLNWGRGDYEAVVPDYETGVRLLTELEQTDDGLFQQRADLERRLGSTLGMLGQHERSRELFTELAAAWEQRRRERPDDRVARECLANTLALTGAATYRLGDARRGAELYEEALTHFEAVVELAPHNTNHRFGLGQTMIPLSEVLIADGRPDEALARALRGREIIVELTEEDPTNGKFAEVLGNLHFQVGWSQAELARAPERTSEEHRVGLTRALDNYERSHAVYSGLRNLGKLQQRQAGYLDVIEARIDEIQGELEPVRTD